MGIYIPVEQGVNLYVEDLNPGGGGKTILFIHGWPLNHTMFEYQFDQLPKAGYRCIGVDLRGYGKSDRPWGGYSYDRMADDIRRVIETLRVEGIILAGFSMGGAIAIRYMARHGGFGVSKLALFAPAAPLFTKRPDFPYGNSIEELNHLIEGTYTDRPKMLEDLGGRFFARYVSAPLQNWFHGIALSSSGHATAMGAALLRDEDLRPDLSKISVPTVIFQGAQDMICPYPLAQATQAGIKNSELVPFAYSGHGLFYCEMGKFNRELMRFAGS
ncbi:alpha/beta hydrolase [Paenibacillus chitinolyticus]|uniref:alpha/beta fold hydrolase n=1 Tax=Paenibacillus chitinolyticus TaxID=79263 RepID=UPI0026E4EFB1|nr:alpha/beta hydrolase [Paenibacillus chitinolyticus]GKS13839.1 alpha/beta hydrolase [Paenibacillus chitinolyticus]